MNTLELDPSDEAVSAAVAGCEVGDEKTITVTGTVREMGDKFVLDVTSAEYVEGEGEQENADEGGKEETAPAEKMPMRNGKKSNPGMVILVGGPAKK